MGIDITEFWKNFNANNPNINHGLYRLSQLGKIPDVPGLYSWYINSDAKNFNDYFKVYKQKQLSLVAKGNLKEEYKGDIGNIFSDKNFQRPNTDMNLCNIASLVFSPPLYLGISVTLRTRLRAHTRELEKVYSGEIKLKQKLNGLKIGDVDQPEESQHFAQRIGYVLNKFNQISLGSIFIKTIELDSTYTKNDLRKVEYYLNRTFIPIYGRQ